MAKASRYDGDYDKTEYKVLKVSEEIVEVIKEKLGNDVLWDYDEDTGELFIVKKPLSYTDALSGLGSEMWKNVGGVKYINQERSSWND